MHSTHFNMVTIYGIEYMVKDISDSEKGNPLQPLYNNKKKKKKKERKTERHTEEFNV